ncbi:hypothetical protein ACHAXA_010417, partial [Cyclostephanos tholiformis]
MDILSTWYKAGAIKGRLVFIALCLLVLIAPLPDVERPQFRSRQVVVVVAPPNQLIAKEVLVKKGAVTHRPPAKIHPIFVSPDQSIAIKDLEEKSLGHTIAKRAPAQSHLIFVAPDNSTLPEVVVEAPANPHPIFDAPDHSIPVEVLDEAPDGNVDDNAPAQSHPTPDQSILTVVLDVNALGWGLMVNAKLAGSFEIDHNARVSKNDPHWGADRTVQVAHVDKVAIKRSLQIVTHPHPEATTCTLIAAYNTSLPFDAICNRTEHLKSTLEDWEAVSALDVGGECYDPHCRKHQNTRSRPNIVMSPPRSTPALECVVFTAIGLELTCEKTAANLTTIKGVYNVSVDFEGSSGLGNDMGEGKNDSNSVQLIGANPHVEPAAKEVAGDAMGGGAKVDYGQLLPRNNKEDEFLQFMSGHKVLIAIGFVVLTTIGFVICRSVASVKNRKADGKYLHKEKAHQTLKVGLGLHMFQVNFLVFTRTTDGKILNKSVALLCTNKNDELHHVSSFVSYPGICVSKVSYMAPAVKKKYKKGKNVLLVLFYLFSRCLGQKNESEHEEIASARRTQNVKRTLTPTTSRPTKKPTSTPTNTNKPTTPRPTTAKPTVQPTSSSSVNMQPSGLPSIAPSQFKCMRFAVEPVLDLVNNTFINPDG